MNPPKVHEIWYNRFSYLSKQRLVYRFEGVCVCVCVHLEMNLSNVRNIFCSVWNRDSDAPHWVKTQLKGWVSKPDSHAARKLASLRWKMTRSPSKRQDSPLNSEIFYFFYHSRVNSWCFLCGGEVFYLLIFALKTHVSLVELCIICISRLLISNHWKSKGQFKKWRRVMRLRRHGYPSSPHPYRTFVTMLHAITEERGNSIQNTLISYTVCNTLQPQLA